jgi:hypothetical protein
LTREAPKPVYITMLLKDVAARLASVRLPNAGYMLLGAVTRSVRAAYEQRREAEAQPPAPPVR